MANSSGNGPQDKYPYLKTVPWRLSISLAVLAILALTGLFLVNRNSFLLDGKTTDTRSSTQTNVLSTTPTESNVSTDQVKTVSLPKLVAAIEAGQVAKLVVQGNQLIATTTDGNQLVAQKESTISALQTLQLLGLSDQALAKLPITVESPTPPTNPMTAAAQTPTL